ncbi:MAG TPA: hypothetical protein VFM57_14890 [Thermoleophilaceae bacterium]|nr:hypothetical protein [Thermoleophilaceae bacterium]
MRRIPVLTAALAVLATVGAGSAQAASVSTYSGTDVGGSPYYYIFYDAVAGENNHLTVQDVGDEIVFDDVVPVGGACSQGKPGAPGDTTARTCSKVGLSGTLIELLDGTNELAAQGSLQDMLVTGEGAASNVFHAGQGDDQLIGTDNPDQLFGHGGEDVISGRGGADKLDGGNNADDLNGEQGGDTLIGGSNGGDAMSGGDGVDMVDYWGRISGVNVSIDGVANDGAPGEGDDVQTDVENIRGTDWVDHIEAQQGNYANSLYGMGDSDNLIGGGGNDITLAGGSGNDLIQGGGGNDGLYGSFGEDDLRGQAGNDLLSGDENNDLLSGGAGADSQLGGPGADVAGYGSEVQPVAVDLEGDQDDGAEGENDRVAADVEAIYGGFGSDLLVGNDAPNLIRGGAGNDEIIGNGGMDELMGEADIDTLRTNDGALDVVDCGAEIDLFEADALDLLTACETNLAPPADPPADPPVTPPADTGSTQPAQPGSGPRVEIRPSRLRLTSAGVARLRVSCPATARERCTGTLRLKRKGSTLGRRSFAVPAGQTVRVKVRVTRRVRTGMPVAGLRVRALVSARDAGSAARVSERRLRILPARR